MNSKNEHKFLSLCLSRVTKANMQSVQSPSRVSEEDQRLLKALSDDRLTRTETNDKSFEREGYVDICKMCKFNISTCLNIIEDCDDVAGLENVINSAQSKILFHIHLHYDEFQDLINSNNKVLCGLYNFNRPQLHIHESYNRFHCMTFEIDLKDFIALYRTREWESFIESLQLLVQ